MRIGPAGLVGLLVLGLGVACQPSPPAPPTSAPTPPPAATAVVPLALATSSASSVPKPSPVPSASAAVGPSAAAPSSVPAPSPRPVSTTAPPSASASRIEVLNAAEAAFERGDAAGAAALYERVTNTPPAPGEVAAASAAIADYAHFRAAVALLAAGREADARAQLDELQSRDANAPLARLGNQLWDQYGMTAQLRAACAQLQPQLAQQAAPVFATLVALGVNVDPTRVCSVP